jgi:hypothetical protein
MIEYVSKKSSDPDARKRKEVAVGLANNATGAAFGAVATQQALALARARVKDKNAPEPTKYSVRAGRAVARKFPKVGRAAMRLKPKNPRNALIALGAVNVGGQALNAGLDAQSAAYFAREQKNLKAKKTGNIEKFDSGMSSGVELYKAGDRESVLRSYQQGLATAGGVGMAGLGVGVAGRNILNAKTRRDIPKGTTFKEAYVTPRVSKPTRSTPKNIARRLKKVPKRYGGKLVIPAALMGGGGYIAQRSYRMGRNESQQAWH